MAMASAPSANMTEMVPAMDNQKQVINSLHTDYIHKVAFDTYGRRMATCSGDRFVRVWDLQDSGEWTLSAQWQAHRGTVTSLSWAHPEFGSLLATCGSDHDAKIWEQAVSNNSGSTTSVSRWNAKASLTEARRGVTCLEFAPRHWGLKLAVGSADGCVRIYEAVDIMNLAQWPLAATLQSFQGEGDKQGCTSISWCTGRFEPPTLVAGGSHLIVYRYSETARAWKPILDIPEPANVLDVAWAPNVGRRYHYIASAEGEHLRIHKLSRESHEKQNDNVLRLESSQTMVTSAWRCQWNVTGTVLACSGDAGIVQMWKSNPEGQFRCVSKVQGVPP
jgi:nucleoporin SEH1